jgi:hypothetical protein
MILTNRTSSIEILLGAGDVLYGRIDGRARTIPFKFGTGKRFAAAFVFARRGSLPYT